MAQNEVVRLFRDVQAYPELKDKYNTASSLEDLVAMAQKDGYDFTVEEWLEATSFKVEEYKSQLSEIPGI
ncbi:Nif11-like leader peptide family natural product precursor [Phormidium sp. CCY1219]|jgi:predicted ribosomally synthesized peptide with nif11-like leader|uniref:Nif11-like leader peptide family natural product precursor n=1 Tax=Phormidium sp. CCY1219 TaxID=2886104 RepID=UPI002D1F16AF|nr:Nif11-like leader peptide family natural product precursor [Phormidium sp. CCY1219]MEB3826366.1 Nif11-like leader peptide family natural product precursor [Phormidium sp. CCY1219]